MSSKGKNLEAKFYRWCKQLDIYCQRFYDARSMGRPNAGGSPADFWVYTNNMLTYIECKDYKNSKSLPLSAFRPSQFKGWKDSVKHSFNYYVLVQLKDGLFMINMFFIIEFIEGNKRKSIPIDIIRSYGTPILNIKDLGSVI